MGYLVSLFVLKRSFFKKGRFSVARHLLLVAAFILSLSMPANAQNGDSTGSTPSLSLKQCIDYALQNQPTLKQAIISKAITRNNNGINISGWLPQVGVTGTFVHYNQLPTTFVTNTADSSGTRIAQRSGIVNTFIPSLTVSQEIFSPNLLYAATSAHLFVKEAEQAIDSTKINIVSAVSKSFYNLLFTLQQIDVLKEDTVRLNKNMMDAYHQYVGGIVDETDYDEATISLNNSKAQLRQSIENVVPQYAVLKQLMGYPPQSQFNVSYDTAQMVRDIAIDTTLQLQYEKRIEYQQLLTVQKIQHKVLNYNRLSFLPSLNLYYNYNYEFESNSLPALFNTAYPYSLVGLAINLPIFTGFSRIENIRKAKLQEQFLGLTEVNLKAQIYTEYTTALANYRSNLNDLNSLQQNVGLARKVYYVVGLQYKQGLVPYLNVITAESNLISSQIGYLNALLQVLSSKIDLEKSMGVIQY
ncbi:MAG: oprM 3 [Bacteroidota bacterium]|nr:oprM 3 [Bacteroidota bacterium]